VKQAQRQVRVVGRPEEGDVLSGAHEGDSGGDYSYDLAHEVNAALQDIPRPRAASPISLTAASTASFTVDLHGDLGYDSAHEGGS
jgi:hypothetical protein